MIDDPALQARAAGYVATTMKFAKAYTNAITAVRIQIKMCNDHNIEVLFY